jgi:hypothetical protein
MEHTKDDGKAAFISGVEAGADKREQRQPRSKPLRMNNYDGCTVAGVHQPTAWWVYRRLLASCHLESAQR